jgi:AMP deaminase
MPEIPSPDEIEVYKILQKCLELRDCYLFREEVAPWEKEVINDPCTPKPNPNPFTFVPEPKSEVAYFCLFHCPNTFFGLFGPDFNS